MTQRWAASAHQPSRGLLIIVDLEPTTLAMTLACTCQLSYTAHYSQKPKWENDGIADETQTSWQAAGAVFMAGCRGTLRHRLSWLAGGARQSDSLW